MDDEKMIADKSFIYLPFRFVCELYNNIYYNILTPITYLIIIYTIYSRNGSIKI
jgi:hypothetical protein